MITIFTEKIKSFTQKNYNSLIDDLPFHQLTCSCGRKGDFVKHGYYVRSLKVASILVKLRILRVKCKSCQQTHALLPSFIIPYSRVPYPDQVAIIKAFHLKTSFDPIMMHNLLIDENNIRYIIGQYLAHWKERIASLAEEIGPHLCTCCFTYFSRQFMQIKCTSNQLFY